MVGSRAILPALFAYGASKLLYRREVEWVGDVPPDPWENIRILAVLNHTSLYEPVFAGNIPLPFLLKLTKHAVIPVADKTIDKAGIGTLYRLGGDRVISITRERDESWERVLETSQDPEAVLVIFPEGRMMRTTGLDLEGRPMTIRGGIADFIADIPAGRMLLAYSGGLHHVAPPGARFPRLFKRISMRLEVVDIESYRESLGGAKDRAKFRRRVVADLTHRRNKYSPLTGPTVPVWEEVSAEEN